MKTLKNVLNVTKHLAYILLPVVISILMFKSPWMAGIAWMVILFLMGDCFWVFAPLTESYNGEAWGPGVRFVGLQPNTMPKGILPYWLKVVLAFFSNSMMYGKVVRYPRSNGEQTGVQYMPGPNWLNEILEDWRQPLVVQLHVGVVLALIVVTLLGFGNYGYLALSLTIFSLCHTLGQVKFNRRLQALNWPTFPF